MIFWILIPIGLPLLYWLITYNGFIVRRNKGRQAFATIDVQLKKRWDLIPNLVSTAKAYAKHEKELFESVTEARNHARNASSSADRFKNEAFITQSMGSIIALAEDYPELKSDKQFDLLQRNLTEVEAQIAASRRSYNAAVTQYNTSLQTVPSNIVASLHKFEELDLFSARVNERHSVSVDLS